MTDKIKPATRAYIESIGLGPAQTDLVVRIVVADMDIKRLIATLKSWKIVVQTVATLDCFYTGAKCPQDCECLAAQATKLMEDWNG